MSDKIDYWSKLKLSECWSEKQRLNIMLNAIDAKLNSTNPTHDVDDTIQKGTVTVIVADKDGEVINNAHVSLNVGVTVKYEGNSNKDGECSLKDVEYGVYDLIIEADGYVKYIDTVTLNEEIVFVETELEHNVEEDNNTDAPTDETVENTGNISVTVVNETGEPVANADVYVYKDGEEPFEATTGKAGGCTVRNVPYGEYTIEAVAEGYDFTVETITVDNTEIQRELILKPEVDDDI